LLDDVTGGAEYHRRDTVFLQVPCGQTHGLVAHRSEGHQDRRIDVVLPAQAE
jgi:hypothetical protein